MAPKTKKGKESRRKDKHLVSPDVLPLQDYADADCIYVSGLCLRVKKHLARLIAFTLFISISVVLFGWKTLGSFGHTYIGQGPDPLSFAWFLYGWPFALSHNLNPFLAKFLWAPAGINLTWATSVPGASILATPIILTIGALPTYNIFDITSSGVIILLAYVLIYHITKRMCALAFGKLLFRVSQLRNGAVAWSPKPGLNIYYPAQIFSVFRDPRSILLGPLIIRRDMGHFFDLCGCCTIIWHALQGSCAFLLQALYAFI